MKTPQTPREAETIDAPEFRAFVARRRRILLGLLLAALAIAALSVRSLRSPPAERAAHFRDLAVEFVARGDHTEAERFFRQAIDETPDDPTLHALLGELLLDRGRKGAGHDAIQAALALDGTHPRANELLARWHFERDELEAAAEHVSKATAIRPAASSALALRAEVELLRGRPVEALATWERLAEQRTGDPRPSLNAAFIAEALSRLAWEPGMRARARSDFERAARIAAAAGEPLAEAHAQLALGRAARALQTLATVSGHDEAAVTLRAAALQTLGRREEAVAVVEAALSDAPSPAAALALARAGRPDRARERLAADAGEGVPFAARAARREILLLEASSVRPDDLLTAWFAERAFTPNPVSATLLAGAGRDGASVTAQRALLGFDGPLLVLEGGGTREPGTVGQDVLARCAAIERASPQDPVAAFWRHALTRDPSSESMAGALDKALEQRPGLVPALIARALARLSGDDPGAALEDALAARTQGPGPATEALVVRALLAADRVDDALAAGREARAHHPWHPTVATALLRALARSVGARALRPDEAAERRLLEAVVVLARGEYPTATATLKPLLAAVPRHPEGRALMARIWSQAAIDLERGRDGAPDSQRAAVFGALALEQAGRGAEALARLEALHSLEGDAESGAALAEMLERHGAPQRAREVLRSVVEAHPGNDSCWLGLADLHLRSGDRDAALDVYRRIVDQAQPGPEAVRAAHTLLEASGTEEDLRLLGAALKRWQGSAGMETEIAVLATRVALAAGRPAEALALVEQVSPTDSDGIRPRLLQAVALAELGEIDAAEKTLAEAAARSSGHPGIRRLLSDVRAARAERELSEGNRKTAARRLILAIRDDDLNDRAVGLLAGVHRLDVPPGPRATFETLEKLVPGSAAPPLFLGLALLGAGDGDAAQKMLEEALAREPDRLAALRAHVAAAGRGGDTQRSLDLCEQFGAANGRGVAVIFLEASACAAAGRAERARALLADALRMDPGHLASAHFATELALAADDTSAAVAIASSVAESVDTSGPSAAGVASVLARVGRTAEAEALLEHRLEIAPDDTGARYQLALLRLLAGAAVEAQSLLERVIAERPRFAPAYFELVRAFQRGVGLPAAHERFESLVVADPGNAAAWCVLGMLSQHRGEAEQAERHYARACDAAAGFALALNNRAWVLAEDLDRPAAAISPATEAVRLDPTNGEYRDTLGWVYFLVGNLTAAETQLDAAVRLMPRSAPAHSHRGRVRAALGRKARAAADYRRVLALDPDGAARAEIEQALRSLEEGPDGEK